MKEVMSKLKDYYGEPAKAILFQKEELERYPILSNEGSTSIVRSLNPHIVIKEIINPELKEDEHEYLQLLGYRNDAILAPQKLVLVEDEIKGFTCPKATGKPFYKWQDEKKAFTLFKLRLALRNLDLAIDSFSEDKNMLCDIKDEHLYFDSFIGKITIIDTDRFLTHLNLSKEASLHYNRKLLVPHFLRLSTFDQIDIKSFYSPIINQVYQEVMEGIRPFHELLDLFQTITPVSKETYYDTSVKNIPIMLKMKRR